MCGGGGGGNSICDVLSLYPFIFSSGVWGEVTQYAMG